MNDASATHNRLETSKQTSQHGIDFWSARTLMTILDYDRWENFEEVMSKAITSCDKSGVKVQNHFLETTKMVEIGSGAERKVKDFWLSRYACYLIAMNGDPGKPVIAGAQTYFAIQSRRQEISDQDTKERIEWRDKVREATKELNSAAKHAGVERYGLFHDHGYRGLYGMNLPAIKRRKGIKSTEKLFDRSGLTELAANAFRATQTKDVLEKQRIKGEKSANDAHYEIARKVRKSIAGIGGTMPENLPAEPSLTKLPALKKPRQISNSP